MTQTVANRTVSTYENVLIINRATSDIIGNTYNCTVMNALGHVSGTLIACKYAGLSECTFSRNLSLSYGRNHDIIDHARDN